MDQTIRDNVEKQRFELDAGDGLVFAEYRLEDDKILVTHTETPPSLQGRGLASKLVRGIIEHARQRDLSIVPLCNFVADYFSRHPDDADVLAAGISGAN